MGWILDHPKILGLLRGALRRGPWVQPFFCGPLFRIRADPYNVEWPA
jgi:hypothetical protein